ncbi:hypothetical protein DaDZ19_32770 [Dickeya ananatis]
MSAHLVVIGNGLSSARLVKKLGQLAAQRYRITLIDREPRASYNRVLLSSVLGGEKTFKETQLEPLPESMDVTVLTGESALRIDRAAREVVTDRRRLAYDHLVLATGARPFMPPLPGISLSGVTGFRTLDDVERMWAAVRQKAPVVVIGGGVLGIEAAAALRLHGAEVTLVHRHTRLMERQLDDVASDLLAIRLRERGIRCLTGVQIQSLKGSGQVEAVVLADGTRLPAGLVVVATGVEPVCELARDSGLPCGRGILVDGQLRTRDEAISAFGECAEINGETVGLVAPCLAQADVLAARLAGQPVADYVPTPLATRLKVTGIDVVSAGELYPQVGDKTHSLSDPLGGHYRRLIFRDDRLCGALLFGHVNDSPQLLAAMETRLPSAPSSLFIWSFFS